MRSWYYSIYSKGTEWMTRMKSEEVETVRQADYWVDRVRSIRRFTRRDKDAQAPYKPLLQLWLIGRLAVGQPAEVSSKEAELDLKLLMHRYRLGAVCGSRTRSYSSALTGGCGGWRLPGATVRENRCSSAVSTATCKMRRVGVDAGHVKRRSLTGSDHIDNGLALSALHHRLFDRGTLGLNEDLQVLVSRLVLVGEAGSAVPARVFVFVPDRSWLLDSWPTAGSLGLIPRLVRPRQGTGRKRKERPHAEHNE